MLEHSLTDHGCFKQRLQPLGLLPPLAVMIRTAHRRL
jgi:hypothetical protein